MTTDELRAALSEFRLSQTEFATLIEVGVVQVNRMVNGRSPVPQYVEVIINLTREVRDLRAGLKAFKDALMSTK